MGREGREGEWDDECGGWVSPLQLRLRERLPARRANGELTGEVRLGGEIGRGSGEGECGGWGLTVRWAVWRVAGVLKDITYTFQAPRAASPAAAP